MTTETPGNTTPEGTLSDEDRATHRKFAVNCFNGTWDFLDQTDRTPKEDFEMIHMAHASRFHWGQIGTALQFARGDWQLSRVYAVLGMGEVARLYAQSSLDHCQANEIGDFDLAFAYEALARASSVSGKLDDLTRFLELATQAGERIAEQDDRDYFFQELNTIPPR